MIARTSHLSEHLVQPLERAVKVNLNPAGGRGDILSVVLGAPTFHEAHPDCAHLGQLVHCFKPMVHRLGEKCGELLVVENLETATRRDLADRGWVESMVVVTVSRLHKYGRVAEALSIHLATHIVEVNSLPNVPSCVLDCRVAVHVGQLSQAEPVVVLVAGVREPVNDHRVVVGVVDLSNSAIEFIVGNG